MDVPQLPTVPDARSWTFAWRVCLWTRLRVRSMCNVAVGVPLAPPPPPQGAPPPATPPPHACNVTTNTSLTLVYHTMLYHQLYRVVAIWIKSYRNYVAICSNFCFWLDQVVISYFKHKFSLLPPNSYIYIGPSLLYWSFQYCKSIFLKLYFWVLLISLTSGLCTNFKVNYLNSLACIDHPLLY